MTFKTALLAASAIALMTPAYADSARWSGFNFGAAISNARVSGGGTGGSNRLTYGLNAGYNWAINDAFVLGANINYLSLSGSGGGGGGPNVRHAYDARIMVGYAFGDGLLYAGVGRGQARFGANSDHNATVAAVGFQMAINENVSYRIEYSDHRFESGGGGGGGGGGGNPQAQMLTVGFNFTR